MSGAADDGSGAAAPPVPEGKLDTSAAPTEVDPRLLAILVCPLTKSPLRYDVAAQELVSEAAGLAYPIRRGIPIMLIDEARVLPV